MKVLVLTNLYPPHHAGTFNLRSQTITEGLKLRGHTVRVLTSRHGMTVEQRGGEVERRLLLNGVYEHPLVTSYGELRRLELENHRILRETIAGFGPDLIHVHSFHGLSKSLVFTLRHSRLPIVYDVTDFWLAEGLREDPWLAWWNRPRGPFLSKLWRAALEGAGKRKALDGTAPTRMMQGYDRMPELYDNAAPVPEAVAGFRFDRIYFCSEALKAAAVQSGFRVAHGEVIYPGIDTQVYVGEVKPPPTDMQKLLWVGHLDARSGATTAVRALHQAREENLRASLSIYGRGDSGYVAELRSYIAMHSLPVEFLPVSNLVRDLPQVYRRHDALVHTTEWAEPFSLIPLEAMASGLPVVGAAAGGVRELLRHGENALTYTPGDAAELAYCLCELERNPAMRTRMAETAQQEVLSNYNETAVMDRIENYLNTSLEVWSHAAS